jgi:ferredoxin/flavodoxin---NADP+ reductase
MAASSSLSPIKKRTLFPGTVLIAAGHGAFTPRKLGNPSVERFENKGVFYTVPGKELRSGIKKVVIVGGGDSAVDWALNLKDIAKETYLVSQTDGVSGHMKAALLSFFHSNVKVLVPYEVKESLRRLTS